MKISKYNIPTGEASPRVALLHKSLAALGIPIDPEEIESRTLGKDTETKLREIQSRAGIDREDRPPADSVTQNAIEVRLQESGVTEARRSFTVSGTVNDLDGQPVSNVEVLAYDLDLQGIWGRRKADTVADLQRSNGFDVLGEDITDSQGSYSITFYDWHLAFPERGTADLGERGNADVVTFAVDDAERIVARSRVVHTDDYANESFVPDLELVVMAPRDDRTEYEKLRSHLDPFLDERKLSLDNLTGADAEIRYLAGQMPVEPAQIAAVTDARQFTHALNGEGDALAGNSDVELAYGLVREGVWLRWSTIAQLSAPELTTAIKKKVADHTITNKDDQTIRTFVEKLHASTTGHALDEETPNGVPIRELLAPALPDQEQRQAYAQAVATFEGENLAEFWSDHLPSQEEFQNKPELIARVKLTMQLTAITNGHQPLIETLLVDNDVRSEKDLLALSRDDWREAVARAGVPDHPEANEQAKEKFADFLASTIDAAYPTHRVAQLITDGRVRIPDAQIAAGVSAVLTGSDFDIAMTKVTDFNNVIIEHAGEHAAAVATELKKLQRIYQVSTSPTVMETLYAHGLDSAHNIMSIPRKSFIATYGETLGGTETALAVYQRAMHVAGRAEMAAAKLAEIVRQDAPSTVLSGDERSEAIEFLSKALPTYTELVGGVSMCECSDCSSVFSPSAYLVELLRFLWRGVPNDNGDTPLDIFNQRRPDIVHLLLTCENAKKILPYVDLVNEIMEYYTASGSLNGFTGYDTGDATEAELRAHPQNSDVAAYRVLAEAIYPFTLPYHQPLDVIRAYSSQLGVSRYDVMRALRPEPTTEEVRAIAAECLRFSPQQYALLTDEKLDGTASAVPLHEAYGYVVAGDVENLHAVLDLMARTGVSYQQLVDLISVRFVNPHRQTLDLVEDLVAAASIPPTVFYDKLKAIAEGTLDAATDMDVMAALAVYNDGRPDGLSAEQLGNWLEENFDDFREVVTLYEPESRCDLETTELRTIGRIYEGGANSGVTDATWKRLHLFIRLWRQLGLTIHETDLLLSALGASDVEPETIEQLEHALAMRQAANLTVADLGVLWGSIDADGTGSLYRKLFLNRAVQRIDDVFKPDAKGRYLADSTKVLGDHRPALLAAFRLRDADLEAILGVARVVEGGNPRAIKPLNDPLTLPFVSTVYRYGVLARALRVKVTDLCALIEAMAVSPFSLWDVDADEWTTTNPGATRKFYSRVTGYKELGLTAPILAYVMTGKLRADGRPGLDDEDIRSTMRDVRESLLTIEQSYPASPPSPITAPDIAGMLALTFQAPIATRLLAILNDTATFEASANKNLNVAIPESLSERYIYIEGSGRLGAVGVMTDADRTELKDLPNTDASFDAAVDSIYQEPEVFLTKQFGGILADLAEASQQLLNRPQQPAPTTIEQRLNYVYLHLVPQVKAELGRRALGQHLSALLDTDEATVAALIGDNAQQLLESLSAEGWSACYFSDPDWTTKVATRIESAVNFEWADESPDPGVPADGFSATWDAFVLAPAGERTIVVEVAGDDDAFKLYIDNQKVLEKASNEADTTREVIVNLDGGRSHRLLLKYADINDTAGVSLLWKTPTSGLEVLSPQDAYPATTVNDFGAVAMQLHRATILVDQLGLHPEELRYILAHANDFDSMDFTAPTPAQVDRLVAYVGLRSAVPQGNARLTDIFTAASADPAPDMDGFLQSVREAMAWDESALSFLAQTHFGLTVGDFRNEASMNRLRPALDILARTGVSPQTLLEWGMVTDHFDKLDATAQLLKRAVAAAYDETDGLEIAGQLSDSIRAHQRDALVAYLLTRPEIRQWGATDADGLYEYLLIDVQMGSCMDTSRVVQASAAVQQFVQRCLLNLESDRGGGTEEGVAPSAIDRERWEWLKQYRVWEANRKVFLYPENWLEPEWRMDRSEFFRDLESYILQNDVTDRTVEEALRGYLTSLDQVANLDVCGTHRENYSNGRLKYLHVFGRTHAAPYKYYHRTWDEFGKWSTWSRVPVDIRATEGMENQEGNSGVGLVPVIWKQRLFLFWPEFIRVSSPPDKGSSSAQDLSKEPIPKIKAVEKLQIRIAWSELVDGKWTPKAQTKEFIEHSRTPDWVTPDYVVERDYLLTPSIDTDTQELKISARDNYWNYFSGSFNLADITSPVQVDGQWRAHQEITSEYRYEFGKRRRDGKLELTGHTYFRKSVDHGLLPVDTQSGVEVTLTDPFFYRDRLRTYFVRPVRTPIWGMVPPPWFDMNKGLEMHALLPRSGGLQLTVDKYMELDEMGVRLDLAHGIKLGSQPSFGPAKALDMVNGKVTKQAAVSSAIDRRPIGGAFGSLQLGEGWHDESIVLAPPPSYGLEFHTFHHPYTSEYMKRLNQGGVRGLIEANTSLDSDNGLTFETAYDPVFHEGFIQTFGQGGFVQRPVNFATRTYYKQNVCFDPLGANSAYNMELFFHVPLYIATRLSKNGRYEEAMKWFHLIYDPTTDAPAIPGESATARYWKLLPFKTTAPTNLEEWFKTLAPNADPSVENAVIAEWRDHPFDPHRVAANRPIAYMKHVVIQYATNLVDWADSLFRKFTRESVFEALQLYVMASHVLGKRPEFVPRRGEVDAESYASLETSWDDFSNALVELENTFPYSSDAPGSDSALGNVLLGIGSALYFCVPPNEAMLEHWDRVEDRLYKIRHCQDIDGVERQLALFAPPIDPAALVQAAAQGLSISSILADLGSPPPIHRFAHLLQRANEFCNEVRGLGQSLLSAFEKLDAEELVRLRTSQERDLLQRVTEVRQRQVLESQANKENLLKTRVSAAMRLQHYVELLGETIAVPVPPTISTTLNADSQLPADTLIAPVVTGADTVLSDSGVTGVRVIGKEKQELDKNRDAKWWSVGANSAEVAAGILSLFPQLDAVGTPLGVGAGALWGGQNLGAASSAAARAAAGVSALLSSEAAQAATVGSYIRREQEWAFQANIAAREIVQLDKQITSADIQIQVTTKELENHERQIEQTEQVEQFLRDKFTGQELYQWMRERLLVVYKQSYTLAYELAKKCEKALCNELGDETASFINYGYWDDSKSGLMAGEELQLALRRMESTYLNDNKRELELTKNISLLRVDPLALLALRETGRCTFSIPEELFDLDFAGHYFRRIKAVRLSIPCIAGPYSTISCTLRLINNNVRVNTSMNSSGEYEHENDEGVWIDDARFRTNNTPVTALVTSTAQSDPGLFELNFRDERYLPFENAGSISEWEIELTEDKELRQLDYGTIADVVLHLSYTAREGAGTFRARAANHVKDFIANAAERKDQPLVQMFSARADFPNEWYAFLRPATEGDDQVLRFTIEAQRLLFLAHDRNVVISCIELFARSTHDGDYTAVISTVKHGEVNAAESDEFLMTSNETYGGLHKATLNATDAGLNLEDVDINAEMTLKMKREGTNSFAGLILDPDEIQDVYVVVHYKLG
ncbi:neuraminidase-like domain-containing protein [Arthrobacter sp. OAP107]|uniref:Tc toxin subunit A-related protein n=1 Tax=Arthrobacter sp. OAP107 TaxID=3156445 RepID=UPI00339A1D44